ncbi:MAG TPA: thymidine phosphorylase [Pseudobdellovibrionaceae bacterium]|nr:thymidine phosphorylase [Pseudobdellovibrionaceae bacterium]
MDYIPAELIKKKRNGEELTEDQINFFINQYTQQNIPDYQMSALLMAIYFKGMSSSETYALTKTMLNSGRVVDLSSISGFKVDKHSTGGVGDKTSLILGPIVASAGVAVPMISGRGLGHTGGTLDKLESIPGFNVQQSLESFIQLIQKTNLGLIGQTSEICPADKKLYALRDVTATVESLPLICASIMSKKIAEGIDGLVLDVKFGSGAFMKSSDEAIALAKNLSEIAKFYGKKVTALITNMNQPLGKFIGNSLEVQECLDIMSGKSGLNERGHDMYADTRELSLILSAHMLFLAKACDSYEKCYLLAQEKLSDGSALKKFKEICLEQGGSLKDLPQSNYKTTLYSHQSGFIQALHTEQIGVAGLLLKAGRLKTSDIIDPSSGIELHAKVGERVELNDALFTVYGPNAAAVESALSLLQQSYIISEQKPKTEDLIFKIL